MNCYRTSGRLSACPVSSEAEHAVNTPILVAWFRLPESALPREVITYTGLRLVLAQVGELATRGPAVDRITKAALLDVCGFDTEIPTADVQAILASCPVAVLVRSTPDRIVSLLPILRARDDACLLDEPLALLAYRTRRLLAGSDHDDLTHLFTRRAFLSRLESELQTASPEQPISVLLIDLDHFKAINDEYGHPAGDRVLMHIASLLPTHDGVFAARFGGEEFALILPGADEASSLAFAEQLREITRSHPTPAEVAVTVSIGVGTTETPLSAQELLGQADSALYAAKGDGRDRVIHVRALERRALRTGRDLRIANFETMQRVLSER